MRGFLKFAKTKEFIMQLGIIGLGRMGGNIARVMGGGVAADEAKIMECLK